MAHASQQARASSQHHLPGSNGRETEGFYGAMYSDLPNGAVFLIDPQYRYVFAGGKALGFAGYTPEQFVGKTIWEALEADLAREYQPHLQTALDGATFTYEHQSHDRWFVSQGGAIRDGNGTVTHALVMSYDITDRKHAEEELRQLNLNLEARIAERTETAQKKTMQLRRLAVELIEVEEKERQRIAELLHEDIQQLLAGAILQLKASRKTLPQSKALVGVEKLLDESIAKTRRLSHELSPAVLHHSGLVAALEWLSAQTKEQLGVAVDLHVPASLQELYSTSVKTLVFRAVQELLLNAAKHAGVDNVRLTLAGTLDELTVTVSDKGQGFDVQLLEEQSEQRGVGLLTIRERVHYVGGTFEVESVPERGTTVVITVPVLPAEESEAAGVDSRQPSRAASLVDVTPSAGVTRVMVADDHTVIRQALTTMLTEQTEIEIVGEASDGQEALTLALELRPDVILMDVSMPTMNGIEATERIKSASPQIRVIGLSMYSDDQVREAMLAAGAQTYLSKTGSSAELLKAIYAVDS